MDAYNAYKLLFLFRSLIGSFTIIPDVFGVNVGRKCGTALRMNCKIDTPAKRAKLAARKNPYWAKIAGGRGGLTLGYRKLAHGSGAWIAKLTIDGRRAEERIGEADDEGLPEALSYADAVAASLQWRRWKRSALIEARKAHSAGALTVWDAVSAYVARRVERSAVSGENALRVLRKYVRGDSDFSTTRLSKLHAGDIEAWRGRLPRRIAPSTENRILNDVRAALNAACETHRRQLPPLLREEIRIGTRARPAASNARKQILSDAEVRRVVEAAFAVDPDGDFARLIMLAAATGARFSQLAAMCVGDIQVDLGRAMVPAARKGRVIKPKPPIAVPLGRDVVDAMSAAIDGRQEDNALLERWSYRKAEKLRWARDRRRPWRNAHEADKLWAATLTRAELPDTTVMYALRHSSIVRGLRAGLPIRLVAASHDTSVEMIEAHYSAFIVDATEDLARRAAISFAVAAE